MKIIIVGMMGCGKSTLCKMLNEIDTDSYIEEKTGKTIKELFEQGEDYFREIETKYLKEIMQLDNKIIATGGGTPIYNDLKQYGKVIYVKADPEVLYNRLDNTRPLKTTKEEFMELFNRRKEIYEAADFIIESETLLDALDKINQILQEEI